MRWALNYFFRQRTRREWGALGMLIEGKSCKKAWIMKRQPCETDIMMVTYK